MQRKSFSTHGSLHMTKLPTLCPIEGPSHIAKESNVGSVLVRSYSFGYDQKLMTAGESKN